METKVTVFDNEHFKTTMTTNLKDGVVLYHEVEIQEHGDRVLTEHYKIFDDGPSVVMYIANLQKKIEVINLCREFVTEMEGYSYYGSNPGIPEDEIEDLVDVLMSKYFLK